MEIQRRQVEYFVLFSPEVTIPRLEREIPSATWGRSPNSAFRLTLHPYYSYLVTHQQVFHDTIAVQPRV